MERAICLPTMDTRDDGVAIVRTAAIAAYLVMTNQSRSDERRLLAERNAAYGEPIPSKA